MSDGRGDQLWGNTVVLFHFDGVSGSQTLTNSTGRSSVGWSFNGNTALSDTQSKFGGTAMRFDGADDAIFGEAVFINADGALNFGTGDFCVEGWIYFNAIPSSSGIFVAGAGGAFPRIYVRNGTGQLTIVDTAWRYSSNTIPVGEWVHIAVDRKSGVLKMFTNGVQGYSVSGNTYSYTLGTAGYLAIGGAGSPGFVSAELNCYMDEVRITKASRYQTNFTPPTTAFPGGPYQGLPVKDNQLRKPLRVNGNNLIHRTGL